MEQAIEAAAKRLDALFAFFGLMQNADNLSLHPDSYRAVHVTDEGAYAPEQTVAAGG